MMASRPKPTGFCKSQVRCAFQVESMNRHLANGLIARPLQPRFSLGNWHNVETVFRFCFQIMLASGIGAIASQARAQSTNAPLYVSINGSGNVSPLTNGEWLVVGQAYNMVAVPNPGFVFSNWEPVNVFTYTSITVNSDGSTNMPVISVVASPIPNFTNQPSLDFVMQPVVVIYDSVSLTITKGAGWQANFEPVVLNIQLGESAVILSWPTNSTDLSLQSTTNLPAPFWTTNLPAPVIINGQYTVTNSISGRQQFYRLSQ
jgi:hypothetical protein